ncbi:N-acetyl-beta-glucosaminyl-glycoprotein 4-beta-N-acetylgalactosaminyltransferase 1 isoform X2 [Nematostella vectensis]|uniref:N-acetyl-beta-glucosaminyl-glycoprotein 4-beta-N-acetylgalactosaminyltransferase 1 isoform X2 n=1 Tax=Nematostella vectensis TaxID=45351 RepID=UPI001390071C|nr:N-acetyl-beta-glucosaminyl-glycoprotein 4-beta-N-acetylgalactosaminyltransferase 1 isoform X2 [Nematostella vectensis]XP_032219219.1 N-acetyl-beta-glucosaminyl-glycoprotein 4-beta-N-acetylgalactosaminyltransferase 1 isoform X2 [Nematostella vectensis]
MLAIRRIKYIIKLSAIALLALTVVIVFQWNEFSYSEKVRRYVDGLKGGTGKPFDSELQDSAEETNLRIILKNLNREVNVFSTFESNQETPTPKRSTDPSHDESTHMAPTAISTLQTTTTSTTTPTTPHSRDPDISHTKISKWKPYQWKREMRGQLNVHVWQAWCGSTVHDLRRNWFYPLYPDLRLTVKRFVVQHFENDYGQRVFGFLHPPLTGQYVFALSSDDSSELWLSVDEDPSRVRLLAWIGNRTSLEGGYRTHFAQFNKYPTQFSKPIFLEQGKKYFVEALHKQGSQDDHLLVGWKIPGFSGLRFISSDSLSMYIDDRSTSKDVTEYAKFIPLNLPSHSHMGLSNVILDKEKHKFGTGNSESYSHTKKVLNRLEIARMLPMCRYSPSYLVNFGLGRYDGVKLIHDSAVFNPNDFTEFTHMKKYDQCFNRRLKDSHGNPVYRVPTVTNISLFNDGSISVLTHDKSVLLLASPEEWLRDFISRNEGSKFEDLHQEVNDSIKLLTDIYGKLAAINRVPVRKANDIGGQVNISNYAHLIVNRLGSNSNISIEKKNIEMDSIGTRGHARVKRENKISSTISAGKVIRKRKGRRTKKKGSLGSYKRGLSYRSNSLSKNKRNRTKRKKSRKRARTANRRLKGVHQNQDLVRAPRHGVPLTRYPKQTLRAVRRMQQDAHYKDKARRTVEDLSRDNGERVHGTVRRLLSDNKERGSMRKLLTISMAGGDNAQNGGNGKRVDNTQDKKVQLAAANSETTNEYDRLNDSPYLQPRRVHTIPPLPFRPYGTVKYTGGMPIHLFRDMFLSRLNMAREYVRRLQRVVQFYRYNMTSQHVSDQIYKRFGIRMSAPPLFPVLSYNPWLYHHNTTKCPSDGNLVLSTQVAKSVVRRYMEILNNKTGGKYALRKILNVEENHDVLNGDRYLIELELHVHGQRSPVRLSQYVYQRLGEETFCQPHSFRIREHATVHVIVPVKNQGRWVQYFIDDMSEIYLRTRDPHFNVIIVDFNSTDIDIKAALERSPLRRYKLIRLEGAFQRAYGIHAGSTYVKSPHDIIFMCDLHLELPNNMIDIIRKHTVEGRMAFAPIVTRLHCGFTPSIPYGFWELQGYGLFAIYKSDFIRVGGMNYREFGTQWGGEDWELLDRVLLSRMEVERLRIPNFYHFYHSKKGMWGAPTVGVATSVVSDYYSSDSQVIQLHEETKEWDDDDDTADEDEYDYDDDEY